MILPDSDKKLEVWADETINICRASAGQRLAAARTMRQWSTTGSNSETVAIYNRLGPHIDRMASYLFSPSGLRFSVEFENEYPQDMIAKADVAARFLSKKFARWNIDTAFSAAMIPALTYGGCLMKQMWSNKGIHAKLVMPWNFGVYREDVNDIGQQEALLETTYITKYEFWRRISHQPNADALYKRAVSYATKGEAQEQPTSFFHNVILAGTVPLVQTAAPFSTQPAGTVNTGFAPLDQPILATEVVDGLLPFHELTVVNDVTGDYSTIQVVEPDIIVTRKRENLFLPGQLPYTLIQPNYVQGYFWGASELQYLLKLQAMLRDRLEDIKQIMSLQYDRIRAFIGFDGMTDEMFDQMKNSGFIAQGNPGAKVEDITPPVPERAFEEVADIIKMMEDVSGFQNILSGQGEPGVRSAEQAQIMMKSASPRMRDRAILVERQCAMAGQNTLNLLQAKEPQTLWTDPKDIDGTSFLLAQLPADASVCVDSHSSSPVYEEDHKQLASFMLKAGVIDGATFVDMLPDVPNRDTIKTKFYDMQEAKAKFLQEHPEAMTKGKPGPKAG